MRWRRLRPRHPGGLRGLDLAPCLMIKPRISQMNNQAGGRAVSILFEEAAMLGSRPWWTPRVLARAMPCNWRSRRRFVSNSAKTPGMSRNALPAAVRDHLVYIEPYTGTVIDAPEERP